MVGMMNFGLGLFPGLGKAGGSGAAQQQNVAQRGQQHNGTTAKNGLLSRMKGVTRFTVGHGGALSLAGVINNFWLNNAVAREVSGAAYTIRKAAISYNGITVPVTFDGNRTLAVTAGMDEKLTSSVYPSQFGVSQFVAGQPVFFRMSLDLPSDGSGIAVQSSPMYLGTESQFRYNPANDIDDVDAVPGMAQPTGAETWIPFPHPVMLVGTPAAPMSSLVGIGDSIIDGSVDNSGDGGAGGGWLRRAAYAENIPYFSLTRTGDKHQFFNASSTKSLKMVKRAAANAAYIALGNNDIRDGRSYVNMQADARATWLALRAVGVGYIGQALVTTETTSTDQNSSLAGQTPVTNFGVGGVKDQFNTFLSGLDGGALNEAIDTPSAIQTNYKFNVPMFQTTLAAAAVAYAGNVSLTHKPDDLQYLVFEPSTPANQEVTYFHVTGSSGAGPYTTTLTFGPTKAHASGAVIKSSLAGDGVHPQQLAHKAMATKAAPAAKRIKGLKSRWYNLASSFEIDFENRRAIKSGLIVPISSFVTCSRASVGRAYDGQSWSDFAADQLRYADGGGLYVEPQRINYFRNNTFQGGVAPTTKPNIWLFNVPAGVTATSYAYGVENGIDFADVRFSGTASATGGITVDGEVSIATAVGDTWTSSGYVALLGNAGIPLTGTNIGGRSATSGGSATEFPTSANTMSQMTRSMKRFSHTFTLTVAGTALVNHRTSYNWFGAGAIDFTVRFGSHQMEKASSATSLITTTGASATREADVVTIALPAGTHSLTFTFDDLTTQTITGCTGNYVIPTNLNRQVIEKIVGVQTA